MGYVLCFYLRGDGKRRVKANVAEDVEYVPWSGKTNNKAFWVRELPPPSGPTARSQGILSGAASKLG